MAQSKPDETRAAAMAALLAGQSVSAVAREYKISRQSVQRWRDKAGIDRTPVEQEKAAFLGDQVVDYVSELLTTLQVQAVAFRDIAWLKAQSADQAAVLHGVLADKAVRILEAIDTAAAAVAEPDPA